MVGVDRRQALPTSPGALTTSRVATGTTLPYWIHWPQAPAAFAIAIIISYMSLLLGFHHKGRPFGSREAITRSVMLISVTALIAAVLSVLVPHLPLSLGIFIPALLCGAVLKENEAIEELRLANPELAAFVTIGISYLLGRARDQMSDDRAGWCDHQVDQFRRRDPDDGEDERASLNSFSVAAEQLQDGLLRRLPKGHGDRVQVDDHYAAADQAIMAAVRAYGPRKTELFREEYNKAEQALKYLLQIAYDWKYDNIIDLEAIANPPRRAKRYYAPGRSRRHARAAASTDDDQLYLPITISAHFPDRPAGAGTSGAENDRDDPKPAGSAIPVRGDETGERASPRRASPPLGTSFSLGTSFTSSWASSATHTDARVCRVMFSSPDKICETRPGETPILRASSALLMSSCFMRHVIAVVTSRGSCASAWFRA